MSVLHHVVSRNKCNISESEETAVPDSTTIIDKEMNEFSAGQDVLLKQKDGRYYLGTVVEVDNIREQCLIKFGDNTDGWSSFKDLTKLTTPEQNLLCVICKKSAPKNKNEIIVCDKCGRGYHQKCHQPEIPLGCQKEESSWMCRRCFQNGAFRLKKCDLKSIKKEAIQASSSTDVSSNNNNKCNTKELPYDINSLHWDMYHRVNGEYIYCYCGKNGEWYKQMLQCARCRQWFHEKCIDSLQYPLYCGDRFYVFICSICNQGKEFLRRLEMKWVDFVHLMLFNLTAFNSKKYYDLDTIIIPYINDNWHALQLPPKISEVNKIERRENILSVLTNNRNRFKCGREIKKRTTIWGLRVRLPPPAPTITLSLNGVITENYLKEMWQGNRRLQFLPLIKTDNNLKIVQLDSQMKNIMMGIAYNNNNPSETDSPCPSPDVEHDLDDKLFNKNDILNSAGCIKKSIPFSNNNNEHNEKNLTINGRDRNLRKPKRRNTTNEINYLRNNDNDGIGYSTRLSLDKNFNRNNNETLPLTPPTSVSAPPTPPTSNSLLSDLSNDFSDPIKSNKLKLNEPDTLCDTSGDETSSKSTLDLIIPPPKDFEGKNNPFLTMLRGNNINERQKKSKKKGSITLPLPLTAVIPGKPVMRPKKRQLSEKDIFIGPNGEVKRRRFRRNNRNLPNNNNFTNSNNRQTASKTATVIPVRPDGNEWGHKTQTTTQNINNCVDYALNGRRLRQRPDKSIDNKDGKITGQITPKPSPVKQEENINIEDLKSSVNIYFGAVNRIASGEPYTIKAKRIGPSGKLEYLIEWDSPNNGMT